MASEFAPGADAGVTEALIRRLVHEFYTRVRADPLLGPVFERAIADDWDPHLRKMCDFWSSVMLMTGRYKGKPMQAHLRLKTVRPAHFERWLALFAATARDVCTAEAAEAFVARSERIAESLKRAMFFPPAAVPAADECAGDCGGLPAVEAGATGGAGQDPRAS